MITIKVENVKVTGVTNDDGSVWNEGVEWQQEVVEQEAPADTAASQPEGDAQPSTEASVNGEGNAAENSAQTPADSSEPGQPLG